MRWIKWEDRMVLIPRIYDVFSNFVLYVDVGFIRVRVVGANV
jgi:hypothetical protein